ncbi:DUF262 domain-containing protein [Sphingobium sp. ZW T5_29]|uniref:GmrSD restriction endonuclease domain-containing protein n=1 Tax=Sphingobium sp. ZW T5_29 TaxID=3378077 RepID=UPI0038525524
MAKSTTVVNLDALIPRGDLFEYPTGVQADSMEIRITDLEPGLIYSLLRKPDFQRETANWSPNQVVDLIETFCAADIIPAIILWQNGSSIFVVDGSHRLSALVGWVRNDFGAGLRSQEMFGSNISAHQRAMHERTVDLVSKSVGPWEDYKKSHAVLGMKSLQIQWIHGRTAPQAAKAFIRINQGGTVIDPLEVRILNAARSALSVATRVLARGGSGHPYWQHFTDTSAQEKVPKLGAEIYKLLYEPVLEMPIKTTEVPLAGQGYGVQTIRLAFDLVALANGLTVPDSTRAKVSGEPTPPDNEGISTLNYLNRTLKAVRLILSNDPSSLGLHPALWFYTSNGTFQSAAFLNVMAWVLDLERRQKIDAFRAVRGQFEELLLAHPAVIKPATHRLGSGGRTRTKMLLVLNDTLEALSGGASAEETWGALKGKHSYLGQEDEDGSDIADALGAFPASVKSAATLADLPQVPRCGLCGGLLHRNGKTLDHIKKKADGGSASLANARWVHPICNSNRDRDERLGRLT